MLSHPDEEAKLRSMTVFHHNFIILTIAPSLHFQNKLSKMHILYIVQNVCNKVFLKLFAPSNSGINDLDCVAQTHRRV